MHPSLLARGVANAVRTWARFPETATVDLVRSARLCTLPRNPLQEVHSASEQPEKGAVYDKKPFKMVCEAGKQYSWCSCGKSKNQPLCDGTHKNTFLKIKLRPVRFTVPETKAYYLCNCKQTDNRPFCDGTHKLEAISGTPHKNTT